MPDSMEKFVVKSFVHSVGVTTGFRLAAVSNVVSGQQHSVMGISFIPKI